MTIIASGSKVFLRDREAADVDLFVYWQTHGGWRTYDGPWTNRSDSLTDEEEQNLRKRFLEGCSEPLASPRKRAMIVTGEGKPIGWVNRYGEERFPDSWQVGIDICEDDFLGKGIGTEALRLWVDYLLQNSTFHRLGADTWSFNPRAIRVIEKVGFVLEGRERELMRWRGQWLDRMHFGMLRSDWENRRQR